MTRYPPESIALAEELVRALRDADHERCLVLRRELRRLHPELADVDECDFCEAAEPLGPCPHSVECPQCHAKAGTRCKRPSGHTTDELHAERIELAETVLPLPMRWAYVLTSSHTDHPDQERLF